MLVIATGMRREARILGRGGEVVISGGENSGLATKIEAAISRGARGVISAGLCGGLTPGLAVGTAVIGSEVVWSTGRLRTDAAWRDALSARIPDAICGVIAGTDAILIDTSAKAALYASTGAAAVDMESHIAAQTAHAHALPFSVLRVVSDGAEHRLPPAAAGAIGRGGRIRIGAVLRSVAADPMQVPELIRTARNAERAMAGLLRCLDLLGVGFACPYLG